MKQHRRMSSGDESFDFGHSQNSLHSTFDDDLDHDDSMSSLKMPRMGMRGQNSFSSSGGSSDGLHDGDPDDVLNHEDDDDEHDSDEDDDSALGLVLDRTTTSSNASLAPMERLDALQKMNTDLGRKLLEAERTLTGKLEDHEAELEEMQSKLDELKSELSSTKREEKELRSKEVGSVFPACPATTITKPEFFSVKPRLRSADSSRRLPSCRKVWKRPGARTSR